MSDASILRGSYFLVLPLPGAAFGCLVALVGMCLAKRTRVKPHRFKKN
jgi:hypothetical protein